MPPDLNSLPTSPPPSIPSSPLQHRLSTSSSAHATPPSPRSPSLSSLAAAATLNAGLINRSPSNSNANGHGSAAFSERRRSSLLSNLAINDPAVPAPGELQHSNGSGGSPRMGRRSWGFGGPGAAMEGGSRQRPPSLGELHQELENEQEAQVNRLLLMIRVQQDQIAQIQRQHNHTPAMDGASPTSTSTDHATFSPPSSSTLPTPSSSAVTEQSSPSVSVGAATTNPPHAHGPFNRPPSLSRNSSSAHRSTAGTTGSRGGSPAFPSTTASTIGPLPEDFLLGGTRDECAFYQAETQMLTRENQMLKLRIRELERQIADIATTATSPIGGASATETPSNLSSALHSPLAAPPATFASEVAPSIPAEVEPGAKVE